MPLRQNVIVIFDLHVNQSLVPYEQLYALAEAIDKGPFQTLWVLDHFAALQENVTHPMLDPFVVLGALAAKTQSLQLGILVANVVNRRPAVLAQASTSLQFMSNSRFTLGHGGAIFVHSHSYYASGKTKPTSGCVSLTNAHLVKLLQLLDASLQTRVVMGTKSFLGSSIP